MGPLRRVNNVIAKRHSSTAGGGTVTAPEFCWVCTVLFHFGIYTRLGGKKRKEKKTSNPSPRRNISRLIIPPVPPAECCNRGVLDLGFWELPHVKNR
ncbi:hypothetical protein BaRGS_00001642 [Batillaria attramentaria]|uniref:Uncharacterized protein n=1 Tax=Batillaria attramentaria TaxID=370345 RepID=A0ABD0M7P0_9CAEN